mmetsp:Transcript_21255/g.72391  ORF Transcript_21255/g.72391 Transcript_21255/m.72391 type:complete len:217 (+) Transcript_21255:1098-1748(+)
MHSPSAWLTATRAPRGSPRACQTQARWRERTGAPRGGQTPCWSLGCGSCCASCRSRSRGCASRRPWVLPPPSRCCTLRTPRRPPAPPRTRPCACCCSATRTRGGRPPRRHTSHARSHASPAAASWSSFSRLRWRRQTSRTWARQAQPWWRATSRRAQLRWTPPAKPGLPSRSGCLHSSCFSACPSAASHSQRTVWSAVCAGCRCLCAGNAQSCSAG